MVGEEGSKGGLGKANWGGGGEQEREEERMLNKRDTKEIP